MREHEYGQLEESIAELTQRAQDMGLDFFQMRYEICPADILYSIGAYGMPTRFSHWSFGKAFHRMKMDYDFNLSKIYELVINSDPCYAYLLENNSLLQNKLIVAHVLGHSDFFKNNAYFGTTNRKMIDSMYVHATQIRDMEYEHGQAKVEAFVDSVLAIQEHIDPRHHVRNKEEDKDLLLFIAQHSRHLEPWQQHILYMMRDEMLYFWPQIETKIMNEGWATYWHLRLMRELDLTEAETLDFAKMHAGVIQPSRTGVNPYLLGLYMFEALDKKYGQEFIFEVREMENDISFLRNYLTKELIQEMDFYLYGKKGEAYLITNKEWEEIKNKMIQSKTNGGFPYLIVKDGDYNRNGELYLQHQFDGLELDQKYVQKTLPHVFSLWGRPVHLETRVQGKEKLYSCHNGKDVK